jgi:hypothetical protein
VEYEITAEGTRETHLEQILLNGNNIALLVGWLPLCTCMRKTQCRLQAIMQHRCECITVQFVTCALCYIPRCLVAGRSQHNVDMMWDVGWGASIVKLSKSEYQTNRSMTSCAIAVTHRLHQRCNVRTHVFLCIPYTPHITKLSPLSNAPAKRTDRPSGLEV